MAKRLTTPFYDAPLSELTRDELKAWAAVGRSGICVHSFYVENCSGCQCRELLRIVQCLVDSHKDGDYTKLQYGVQHSSEEAMWDWAEHLSNQVEKERYG